MGDTNPIKITVNGRRHSLDIGPNISLLDLLRDTLHLHGSKECCGVGECGACTVSVDGRTVNACLMLAVEVDDAEVVTIEGLGAQGLNALQEAFIDQGAVQCGFCIPGMLMSAQALLDEDPQPDDDKIRERLSGNLCRCGGYNRIVAAVRAASRTSRNGQDSAKNSAGSATEYGQRQPDHATRRDGQNVEPSVGANVRRFGGRERVSGNQQFLADIPLAGMLHVKLVTLDAARARIVSIDTTQARAVPGVVDVITADELPTPVPRFGPVYKDRPVLAVGETKYHGEPVAAVAAESKEAAELAVSLVRVAYEALPAVFSVAAALARMRHSCRTRPFVPAIRWPRPISSRSGDMVGATSTLRRPISLSRILTHFQWLRILRSSLMGSWRCSIKAF